MHFITFPVATTNIFPLTNSKHGGQLATEYNLKSREMVATNPAIKYRVGPSFIHSMDDFKIKLLEDTDVAEYDATKTYDKGDYCRYNNDTYVCIVKITTPEVFDAEHWAKTSISTSIIQVDPGRAVINGHFVETLAPMIVDLNVANAELKANNREQLYGNLSIGIRAYFSTDPTMAGAMLVENTDNMYVGVQLVIEKTSEFKTPNDCPELSQQNDVNADIKLADFTYVNGTISSSSILPNTDATRYIPSARIFDFDDILDDKYVTSENLVDKLFYTYSGMSGWCDSTGNLMVWDANPTLTTATPSTEASFQTDARGNVKFVLPHKQQDGILNDNGDRQYYKDKVLTFPTASYDQETSGVVTKEYTQNIKAIANTLNTYKQFTNGKQIMYLDTLSMDSEGNYSYEFPKDLSNYNVGDYILVREDYTMASSEDSGSAPSTMYFVLPGGVTAVTFNNTTLPTGVRLGNPEVMWQGDPGVPDTIDANHPSAEEVLEIFNYTTFKGTTDDYFELVYHNTNDTAQTSYYYKVSSTGPKTWSDAVLITGGIPLATETQVGGFYNASTDTAYADAGYVYLDSTGHLRLMDYALLRSGTLAYQLGEDFRVPSNQTLEYIQAYLDESVNVRIAFISSTPLTTVPNMIHVYIPLPAGEEGTIYIHDIDSRFDTGVYLHFLTEDKTADYSNIVINIVNCEKIRIDNSITTATSGPMINIFKSGLYYDASLINYIRLCDPENKRSVNFYNDFTGFDNLSLWYAKFTTSDPDLVVNGMEISQPNVTMTSQEIAFWDETLQHSDVHYYYALRSITLSESGRLIACSMYVADGSTHQNVSEVNATTHTVIGGDFVLPQGSDLNYPLACVDSPIKITGTFSTGYKASNDVEWIVTDTTFSAKSGVYNAATGMENGSIVFNSASYIVPATYTHVDQDFDAWDVDEYHIFYGGTTV